MFKPAYVLDPQFIAEGPDAISPPISPLYAALCSDLPGIGGEH